MLQLNLNKKEISLPQHAGSEVVVKSENDAVKWTHFDSPETSQNSKLREEWALNYKSTFLSPQKFSSTSEHFELIDVSIKDKPAIKEEPVLIDDPLIYSHSENFDIDNAATSKQENENVLLYDNSEEIIDANRNQNDDSENNHAELKESTKVDTTSKHSVEKNSDPEMLINMSESSKFESQGGDESLNSFNDNVHSKRIRKCDLCSYETSCRWSLKRHIIVVHKKLKPIQCKQCNFRCHRNYLLNQHINVVHNNMKPFECSFCNYKTGRKANLLLHVNAVHRKIKRYPCSYCEKGFAAKRCFEKHLEYSHNKQLQTNTSDSIDNSNKNKNNTSNVNNSVNENKCEYCTFSCRNKWNLAKHVKAFHQT